MPLGATHFGVSIGISIGISIEDVLVLNLESYWKGIGE